LINHAVVHVERFACGRYRFDDKGSVSGFVFLGGSSVETPKAIKNEQGKDGKNGQEDVHGFHFWVFYKVDDANLGLISGITTYFFIESCQNGDQAGLSKKEKSDVNKQTTV